MTDSSKDRASLLNVDAIDIHYGDSHILKNVSLEVQQGEVVSLIGRNGAGKTTTLKAIQGLVSPTNGQIVFQDSVLNDKPPHEVRQLGISLVPEERRVFQSLTVEENIRLAMGASDDEEDGQNIYELFEILDERRNQKAGTLSGGEQQMLAIARALTGPRTKLLMLDEPSEGLAPLIVEDVQDVIQSLKEQGRTILLVEQNAELALELADRSYILEEGQIVYEGKSENLIEDRKLLERYVGV